MGSLDFSARSYNPAGVDYKIGDQTTYILGEFNIENTSPSSEDKDIKVQNIVLRNQGGGDLSNLKNIKVYRDSEVVSQSVTVDGRNVTIVLNDEIKSGRRAMYTIQAEVVYVDSQNGDEYEFTLNRPETDLVAVESKTNFRTSNSASSKLLTQYTVNGGKIVFATDSSFPKSVDAGMAYTDVVVAAGTITVAEPIFFDRMTLSGTAVDTTSTTVPLTDVIKKATLEIGGSRYPAEVRTDSLYFSDDIYVNKTSNVRLVVDIETKGSINDYQVSFVPINGMRFGDGEYQNSTNSFVSASATAGSISVATLTIKDARFNFVKTSSESELNVVKGVSDGIVLFKGKITNNQSTKITINNIFLTGEIIEGVVRDNRDNLYLDLEVGTKTSSKPYTQTTTINSIPFNSLGVSLAPGESVDVTLKASPTMDFSTIGSIARFTMMADGTDDNGNTATTSSIFAVNFKLTAGGSADINGNSSNVAASAFAINSIDNAFAQWTVTVKDETLRLKEILIAATPFVAGTPEIP